MTPRKTLSLNSIRGSVGPNGVQLGEIKQERFYAQLTAKTTVNGKNQYSWTRVTRGSDGSWQTTSQTGGPGFDPAFEFNEASAVIGNIYELRRDESTGQPLFF
jgi:hypothetical protein